MAEFNAKARAEHCVSALDGHIETIYDDEQNEDCVNREVFDILEGYIQRAYDAGRAELAEKTRELWAKGVELEHSEAALTEARAENERLRAVVERVRNAMAIGADPEQFEQLYQAWLNYEAQQRELTTPPAEPREDGEP